MSTRPWSKGRWTGTNSYALSLPSNPGVAVPGYYMLFAISAVGVPSVSKIVQFTGNRAPTLINPGNQTTVVGSQAQITVVATPLQRQRRVQRHRVADGRAD